MPISKPRSFGSPSYHAKVMLAQNKGDVALPARFEADAGPAGSAAVVDPATGRLLLLFHAKVQRWLQPGGHADGDANLAAVERSSVRSSVHSQR